MTKHEKMTQRLDKWRKGLEALERKVAELTIQIERQRGAIAATEELLAMVDDEVVMDSGHKNGEQPADAPAMEMAT